MLNFSVAEIKWLNDEHQINYVLKLYVKNWLQ